MFQSVMISNNPIDKSISLYQRHKVYRYMKTIEVVACIVVIISSSIWSQVVKENVQILSQCGTKVPSLPHLICTMLTDMGGNWGFEGQCHGNNIKTCQYSLSRLDGFCGFIFVAPWVSLFPTWIFFRMLIGDLSNTPDDDDYNMHINLLSIV